MSKNNPNRRLSFFLKIILLFNFIAVVALLASYLSFYINPNKISLLAFAGLSYPVILIINVAFVIFWLLTRLKFIFLSLIFILLGWNHIGRLIQFREDSISITGENNIKIVSYNIQNFLKINTSTTKYITEYQNQYEIIDFIKNENASIICLQEILNDKDNYKLFLEHLGNEFQCPNNYYENYFRKRTNKIDGLAILTRYPIINKGFLTYDDKTIAVFGDLIISNDTVRLYNIHMASIHFKKEEYDFFSEITANKDQQKIKENSFKIISKMRVAFIKRGNQAAIIKKHIDTSSYPVIICGDFNDTPSSYAYNGISKGLTDAFVESGKGLGITYAGENFPAFRIDYIFHSPIYESSDFVRHKINLSDHYPISCVLNKKDNSSR